MNIRPDQTVVIGDQMLTDVFGGNRRGLYTIMVVPVKRTDGFITKIRSDIHLSYCFIKRFSHWLSRFKNKIDV
jgi:predicted HAD superfamily phosphohydrolase YqeG